MSRTDAHRPPFVWMNDHPELVFTTHQHTTGECTLPVAPYGNHNYFGAPNWSGCYAQLSWQVRICGCAMCTGAQWRKLSHRRRRAAERVWLSDWRRGADEATIDRSAARVHERGRCL